MAVPYTDAIAQLDAVIAEWTQARRKARHDDLSDLVHSDPGLYARMIATFSSAIQRLSTPGSSYRSELQRCRETHGEFGHTLAPALLGVVQAMRADYDAGRVQSIHEIVHAEVFADFLDAATHLLEEGYKDPAAVIAGSVLEEHLRKLGAKHAIATTTSDGRAKKASLLNAELKKAGAYANSDEKQITAWLDLRNLAAHGHYADYESQLVRLMLAWVKFFVSRYPA